MLRRGYIAQECRTRCRRKRTADGRGDVVIAGGNICYQGPQYIKRCAVAECFLNFHICGNLIHGHVAGAFNHYLHILRPCALCQLPKGNQLLNLCRIGCIRKTAGAAGIPKAHGDIIFPTDIQNFIVMLIKRVFVACHFHPCKHDGAAAGNNIHQTLILLKACRCCTIHAAMDGHEIYAVLCVHPHDIQPFLCCDLCQRLMIIHNGIINRHGANHGRAIGCQLAAEASGIPVGA